MENTRIELEEKLMEKTKGVMFRCKAKWYELGEKNTEYFFALEKAKYNAKTCYKMINETGQEISTPDGILQLEKEFYQNLYQEDKEVEFNLLNNTQIRVPQEIQKEQEIQITCIDLEKAIKGMKNNKTPGEDGIPIDFYKVFWNKLKEPFHQLVLECHKDGVMHETARHGILNLIPKANKDTRYIKNLRPITTTKH